MFKKGFKALKSIGKKSKKKEKGDGDNVSQVSEQAETSAALQGSSRQSGSRLSTPRGAEAAGFDSRSTDGSDLASPITTTPGARKAPPGATASRGSPLQSKVSKPSPTMAQLVNSREKSAEDSVVAMLEEMKKQKEAEKLMKSQPTATATPTRTRGYRLSDTEPWPEDDNSSISSLFSPPNRKDLLPGEKTESEGENSSSTESELTFQKKLRAKKEREEKRNQGRSVSSSSSEASSWGDASEVLPPEKTSSQKANSAEKPEVTSQTPVNASGTKKPSQDTDSDLSGSEVEGDDAEPRLAGAQKPQTAQDLISEGSSWSDTDDEEGAGNSSDIAKAKPTSVAVSLPTSHGKMADEWLPETQTKAKEVPMVVKSEKAGPAPAVSQSDKEGSDNGHLLKSSGSDQHVLSESESVWSEDDQIDDTQSKRSEHGNSPNLYLEGITSKPALDNPVGSELKHVAKEELQHRPSESSLEPRTAIDQSSKPVIARQQSEESLWSDEEDDDIEKAAAPLAVSSSNGDGRNGGEGGSNGVREEISKEIVPTLTAPVSSKPVTMLQSDPHEYGGGMLDDYGGGDNEISPTRAIRTGNQTLDGKSLSTPSSLTQGNITETDAIHLSKLTALEEMRAKLDDENEDLKSRLAVTIQDKEKLEATVQLLESKAQKLESTNGNLEKDNALKKSIYDDVTQKLKVIMDENQRLVNENTKISKSLSDEIARVEQEKRKLEAELEIQHKKSADGEKEKAETGQLVESWKTKYAELETASGQQQQHAVQLDAKVKDLTGQLNLLKSEKAELEVDKRRAIENLELFKQDSSDKDSYELQRLEMERMVKDHNERMRKLTLEMSENNKAHDSELKNIHDTYKQQIDELNEANTRTAQRVEKRIETLNGEIASLQSDNKELQGKYSKLRTEQSAKNKQLVSQSEYDEQKTENEILQLKVRELERKLQHQQQDQHAVEPAQTSVIHNTLYDDGHESRSREIQLRRERAERELQAARERQRLRHNSTGSMTTASCDSTPRRGLSPRNANISASSSDDDEDLRHRTFNGNGSLIISDVQQKELDRREEKINQLKSENAGLQKTITSLSSENRSLTSQLQVKQDEGADLKVQNEKLYEKLNIRDKEVTMELNKKLENELVADAEHGKQSQQIVLLESTVSRLKEANSRLEQRLSSVTAELGVKENLLRTNGQGQSVNFSMLDSELVQVRTELAQMRSNSEVERATFMAAIDEKDREMVAETAEKESAKAALDEVTKSLMYLQDDINTHYISIAEHQELLNKAQQQDDKMHKDLTSTRARMDTYSKEALEAKNVCSMQLILLNEKDRELRDKDKELRSLKKELDGKIDALSNSNGQLQQAVRERDRERDRLREEMMTSMSRHHEPQTHAESISYRAMYEELRVDKEREKATTDQLIERLKWEISTLEERLQKSKEELKDKVKLETNFLLAQSEAERYKQEALELVRKATKLEERVEQQQRDSDYLKDSRHEVGASNQTLKDENSRLRENNTELKAQLDNAQRELSGYSVTKDEMEIALATAKLSTDVNDMSRQENETEVQLERKHKMILYKQAKNLRTEINEKNVKLQEFERIIEKLKNKVVKLKAENNALYMRVKDRGSMDSHMSWDVNTGLTQTDMFQQEVKQLQSQLESTTNNMQSQARKAKTRKYDLNYYQTKSEDLEKQNQQLSSKLNDSVLMIQAAEQTATALRQHITELNNRLLQYEQLEMSTDMTLQELKLSQNGTSRSLHRSNNELEREVRQLKTKLSAAEVELAASERLKSPLSYGNKSGSRSRSSSPSVRRSKTASGRYGGSPTTEYERDRRALTRAAWAVLDDHGLGPPAEQRVFENLDRIWRRNASRPFRRS